MKYVTNIAMVIPVLFVAGTLMLTGCETTERVDGAAPPAAPGYAELREAYNRGADRVDQLWSRAVVELRWVDEEGESQFEQGDGNLIVRKPDELALTVGKLGNVMFWIGSDQERYWLFDLNPPRGGRSAAYVGYHRDAHLLGADELPLPVQPDQLIGLLGVTPLPASDELAAEPEVRGAVTDGGAERYVVELPVGDPEDAIVRRVYVDPRTNLPMRIEYEDAAGIVVEASLSNHEAIRMRGAPPGAWPDIATRVEVVVPRREARMTVFLSELTDGRDRDRVRDVQFDFERLVEQLGPDEVRELAAGGR